MKQEDKLQQLKAFAKKHWYNKFAITLIIFIVWVTVFDKYNFVTQRNLSQSIEKLKDDKRDYDQRIVETTKQLKDIELNKEKYAREHYYMHKPNEEIIVINIEEN